MSTPEKPPRQPLLSLIIDDKDGEELTITLTTAGLTLHQTRELMREAMLNLDQKIWAQEAGATVLNLPASAF